LGYALAKELHALEATVYAVSRTQADLEALKGECPGIQPVLLDIADWTKTRETLDTIVTEPVDILINNAAIPGPLKFMEITSGDFDEVTNINLKSVVNISQICAGKMITTGRRGSIINISSMYAIRPQSRVAMYSSLKAALDALTKTMSVELGPHNIRVVSMNFGYMWTSMLTRRLPTEQDRQNFLARESPKFPSGNVYVPIKEAVNSILFVTSGLVDSMTGCGVLVDGGYCAA
ncbi:unnamed protein product, partial [Allacma fusca]